MNVSNYKKNITYLLLPVILFMFFPAGCSLKNDNLIVTINDTKLYREDFLYDIYLVEKDGNKLEDYYQKTFGSSYWDFEYNGITAREAAKSSVLTSVVMYEILSDQAKKNGMELTQDELSADEKAVMDILSPYSEESESSKGFTYDTLKKAVDKKTLGNKLKEEIIRNFKIDEESVRNSLKPEDYREYQTECLYIPCYSIVDKNIVPLNDEEASTALSILNQAQEKLAKGEAMDSLKETYPELNLDSRNFVDGDPYLEVEYQTAAMALQNNEFSGIVESKYGYYIIHMLNDNSPARYEKAVQDAIKAQEDDQFAKAYQTMKDQYDITINFDYWDEIRIGQITVQKNVSE
jgi:hypothetical protein